MKTLCVNDSYSVLIFFLVKLMIFQLIFIIASATIKNVAGCEGVPEHCPRDRIDFRLYTNQSNEPYHPFDLENKTTILNAKFHPNAPIKFILHGYTGSAGNELMQKLIREYLKSPTPINVVMVNYDKVAREGCYPRLFWNAGTLGKCGAKMINEIITTKGVGIEKFHVIGFSIGAHIAAEISNHLKLMSLKLNRITGLDPAFMLFFPLVVSSKHKLNKQHAKFVDVIHTNTFWYGIPYSGAHYDFYANGGRIQPDCEEEKDKYRCYHKMAVEYFISTINNTKVYKATKISCSIWWWLIWDCSKTSPIRAKVGEHAFRPTELEEGAYNFDTRQDTKGLRRRVRRRRRRRMNQDKN